MGIVAVRHFYIQDSTQRNRCLLLVYNILYTIILTFNLQTIRSQQHNSKPLHQVSELMDQLICHGFDGVTTVLTKHSLQRMKPNGNTALLYLFSYCKLL